ncbi:glycosyltransferase [Candidatus Pelagibacter sp.]|nr:glycosyltransferase [Candidatus Pelagibacter sp.]
MNSYINIIYSFIISKKYFIYESIKYFFVKKRLKNILNKKNPLISILLPTFNRSKILKERAIKTVLSQSYKKFELIIIDDGSTDNTEEVVKKINDKRIRYFKIKRDKNRYPNKIENHWFAGPVIALNYGITLIKGEWIARIDDDDIWTKNHLRDLLNYVRKKNAEFVSSDYIEIRKNKKKIIKPTLEDKENGLGHIGAVQTWLYAAYLKFFNYNINSWRKKINRVNDLDLQERFVKIGIKICYLNKVTCIIKPRPNESQVGLKAYLVKNKEIMKKFD